MLLSVAVARSHPWVVGERGDGPALVEPPGADVLLLTFNSAGRLFLCWPLPRHIIARAIPDTEHYGLVLPAGGTAIPGADTSGVLSPAQAA